ncbi:hypothetical protein [Nocardioides scoriae]|uniref:hypothetical protein n=1 Tax=Nocardioides scoriae TaxID=642780 RepID=UPI0012FB8380|nr:hypothetical protein [Nocardioides scoriae]
MREVHDLASARGVRIAALGSATEWIDDPRAALAWQADALATGLFDGVHLDVEPWLHPAWDRDRARVVVGYLHLLDLLAEASVRRLEVDVAWWGHEVATPGGVPLDRAVAQRVDATTAMVYRDTATGPDSVTDLGRHVLATAAATGTPCRLAVETRFVGTDPASRRQSFWGRDQRVLHQALAAVDVALRDHPSYAGTAVHDHRGWTDLPR